jgi:hypothetical protein
MVGRRGTKYDDWGWHLGGVFPADQPDEHGLVHMAAYLAWIIRRGWYNPEFYNSDEVRAIEQREPGFAAHLMEWGDGKLVDELMTEEGVRFSDYYYADAYLTDWAIEFSDFPDYGVADVPDTHVRIGRVLDKRYDDWVRGGRPLNMGTSSASTPWGWAQHRHVVVLGAVVIVTVVAVAVASALLDLRRFPWPLIQLSVIALLVALFTIWFNRDEND